MSAATTSDGGPEMYDIAPHVLDWQGAGREVLVVRLLDVRGMSSRWPGSAMAVADGTPPVGSLVAGAADRQVREIAAEWHAGDRPRRQVVELPVGTAAAAAAGLSCGGRARVLLHPAEDVDASAWELLANRRPVALVTPLTDPEPTWAVTVTADGIGSGPAGLDAASLDTARTMLASGVTDSAVVEHAGHEVAITALWPTPRLVVVGGGLIADALRAQAALLGWDAAVTDDVDDATARVAELSGSDGVVVLSHDRRIDGPVLAAALAGRVGYVGALGSRRTQSARAEWLVRHGVPPERIAGIHGPAGLDIGSRTPAEIALAVTAEMLAVRAGASGGTLRDRARATVHA